MSTAVPTPGQPAGHADWRGVATEDDVRRWERERNAAHASAAPSVAARYCRTERGRTLLPH